MSLTLPAGYTLLRPVGAGGMAELFLVEKVALGGTRRQVVLKRILPGLASDATFRDMFVNEARVAMQLTHANIVQVYDLREADGSYVIEMEYVAGTDLTRLVRSAGKLPVEVALYVATSLLRALGYAHRQHAADGRPVDLVHRDVSPGNILLSTEGEVKLTDFGLARSRDRVGQSVAGVKGTFAFMSPEQAEGRHVDARADLFAVGAVLYAMLAGESPFEGGGPAATLDRVREVRYEPLDAALGLDEILARALARDVESRYADADAMRLALEEHAARRGLRLGPDALAALVRALPEPTLAPAPRAVDVGLDVTEMATPQRLAGSTRAMTARPPRASGRLLAIGVVTCAVLASGLFYVRARLRTTSHAIPPTSAPPTPSPPTVVAAAPAMSAPAPALAVKRPGFVTVSSDPWAYVTIDGKRRGTTPLMDLELAAGAHEVELENPPLGAVRHLHVRLRAGEHRKIVEKLTREEP